MIRPGLAGTVPILNYFLVVPPGQQFCPGKFDYNFAFAAIIVSSTKS